MIYLKSVYSVLLTIYILLSMLVPLAGLNKLLFVALLFIYVGYIFFFKKFGYLFDRWISVQIF